MLARETPPLSVVMPVHNAMPYLDIAVESILGQTFQDFEFVILDDASTDGSTQRLREWAGRDPRIRLIEERHNLGPALSSQRVAVAARAPVVARMDADDISNPHRLAEQLDVLNSSPAIGVVGGFYDIIDASGRRLRGPEAWRLIHPVSAPPFGNGPLMYRREVFDRVGGYRKECEFWEDHDLIIRMSGVTTIMIVTHSIYQVRQSPVSTRSTSERRRVERALDLMYRCRDRLEKHLAYDDLLNAPNQDDVRVDPRVFISVGSRALWSGGRPRLFRRLLKRGELRTDFRTISAMVWTVWASLEPRSLRAFIHLLLLARRARASFAVSTTGPMRWSAPTLPASDSTDRVWAEQADQAASSAPLSGAPPARARNAARALAK